MIEPTTSTTSGTAEDADQGGSAQAVARTEDVNPDPAAERAEESNSNANSDEDRTTEEESEPSAANGSAPEGGSVDSASEETDRDALTPDNASSSGASGADDSEPEESEADKVARLEREGDVAADYLEELLDIADLDGDIDLDVEGDRAVVAVVGGELQQLTGSDGAVLDALQELTRLAVLRETGSRSRLMLDIGGFRARRRQDLEKRAAKVADEVSSSGNPVRMDPMTPFERKIVHDTVAAKGLVSESEGEEPNRRVVVKPS